MGIVDHDVAHRLDRAASRTCERFERRIHHRRGNSTAPVPLVDQKQREPSQQAAVERGHDHPSAAAYNAVAIGDNQPAFCPFERCDIGCDVAAFDSGARDLAQQHCKRRGIGDDCRPNMPGGSGRGLGALFGDDSQRRRGGPVAERVQDGDAPAEPPTKPLERAPAGVGVGA